VRGALDGNLLPKCSKALSFDPGAVQCPHCHSEQIIKESREILGETLKLR
jgi:ssDNA-binding Zn-finger/Zn-ribbon topoisomerase 1